MGHWPAQSRRVRSAHDRLGIGRVSDGTKQNEDAPVNSEPVHETHENLERRERRSETRVPRAGHSALSVLAVAVSAALGVVPFIHPIHSPTRPFAAIAAAGERLSAGASLNAFGLSRAVQLRFALPGEPVEFPLEVSGDLSSLSYVWVNAADSESTSLTSTSASPATIPSTPASTSPFDTWLRPLSGGAFVAPNKPGFYHLALVRGAERQVIPAPTLAVMVPYRDKIGGVLNGYHIGTYVADRLSHHDHPVGFLEVHEADVNLKVSDHLRLGDFLTHDRQSTVWPKYVALNPRLLDKLELVLAKIGEHARLRRPDAVSPEDGESGVALDVHSGFRTPDHNGSVDRSAYDSRHEYGDAADVAIDADGDGRVTQADEILVEHAVDQVEKEHPELVGGLGLYTSEHYRTPYVHIDTRGTRTRWKG